MTRRTRARAALLAGTVSLALAACTVAEGGGSEPAPSRSAPSRPAPSQPVPTQPVPTLAARTEPLVLAVHATRTRVALSPATARAVLRGHVRSWAGLGEPAGRLRVVAAPGTPAPGRFEAASSGAAVRAVVRDRDTLAVVPAHALGPQVRAVAVGGVDPVREAADYPLRVPTRAPDPGPVVTLAVVGDVMLARGVRDPAAALRPMAPRLRRADLTIGNLESTLSRAGAPRQGNDSFGADPEVARLLANSGFDALSLANNHAGDFGDRALAQTVRRLRAAGLRTFGAGADGDRAWAPAVVERHGVRFGFLGFNAIGETPAVTASRSGAVSVSMPPRTGPLDRAELDRFLRAVRDLDRRVDVVVVLPHWGTQYTHRPEPVQRRVGRALVRAGADLVVGGHPHWVQGVDLVGGVPVAHSLGNFVFDMDFMPQTMEGVVLEATFTDGELRAVGLVPYRMDPRTFAPRPLPETAGRGVLADVWSTSGVGYRR